MKISALPKFPVDLVLQDMLNSMLRQAESASTQDKYWRQSVLYNIRTTLLTGTIIVIPMVVTFVIFRMLFGWMDSIFSPVLDPVLGRRIPGLGMLLTLLLVLFIGLIAPSVLGRRLLLSAEGFLLRIPLVKSIYAPARQLVDAVVDQGKHGFKQVVMVEYPRSDAWTLGFLTGETTRSNNSSPALNVFVPTAPNPVTGLLLIVPPERLRPVPIPVEKAVRFVISGGAVVQSPMMSVLGGGDTTIDGDSP